MKIRPEDYAQYGITPEDVAAQPSITPQINRMYAALRRQGTSMPRNIIAYLRASDSPEARKVLKIYDMVQPHQRHFPIEFFCVVAEVSTLSLLGKLAESVVRMGATLDTVIGAAMHPQVVEKTVEMALRDEGIEDRTILHKATGFLPSPKGAQTTIHLTQNATAQVAEFRAPSPEQTIRRLVDRFHAERGTALPPSSASEIPSPVEEKELVVIPTASEEEEADE